MFGRWITGLIVVALAVGVWALWPRDDATPPTITTTAVQAAPTTSTDSTTTTSAASTTTTSNPSQGTEIIETVEEAEEVLRELWFGWFEGIYNQDVDRIKEVVASQSQLDAAIAAFDVATFVAVPTPGAIEISETEILRTDSDCLAAISTIDVSEFRGEGATSRSVEVLRQVEGHWKFVASWSHADDLWEQDCEAQLESVS